MPRYNYHYFYQGKEISRNDFELHLQCHCARCDTNYSNPLLNISYTDTKKFDRYIRHMKAGQHYLFIGGDFPGSYYINKEVR